MALIQPGARACVCEYDLGYGLGSAHSPYLPHRAEPSYTKENN
jgi:hypothetical protein